MRFVPRMTAAPGTSLPIAADAAHNVGPLRLISFCGGGLSVLSYFRSPFPSTKGFSAYRMPGVAVHGPLIFSSAFVGFLLCWPHPMLRPLMIVWMLAGLYLGRDITILCHYNPLLTLLSWAAFGAVLFKPGPIARFGASHVVIPAILSSAIGAVLFFVAFSATREASRSRLEKED
jgi:hypothetical protein